VALFLILAYIAFRFDLRYAPGAVLALAHDVAISVGVFSLIQMEITLPTIAALLTVVGYSLNDTIVVFDRIREALADRGENEIEYTINQAISDTLSRTIMTSLTTLVAVGAIFVFGAGLIKDFAFALIVGIIVGTYSSVFVASPAMLFMHRYLATRRELKARTESVA
jgi:preprotein translocase subunit SecF